MDRRVFMKSGAMALVTMGLTPSFLRRTAFGADLAGGAASLGAARGKTLICLFQRGAADALNVVVPHGEAAYYRLRPDIAVARPVRGATAAGAIDLDGFFGLHPALAPMKPLWDQGILAPVHAVGSPSSTRSHFDAQDYMETATPGRKGTREGWLNRHLALQGTCEASCTPRAPTEPASPFRAVSMTQQTPRILEGPAATIAMNSLDEFSVRTSGPSTDRLEALYRTGRVDVVHAAGGEMFEAVKILRAANPQQYRPQHDASYPNTQFGQRLRQIAQLVKAGVGLEVAFADIGGWDTHVNQGAATGQLAARLDDFARSIGALVTDLGDRMADTTIVTMSEFGRTVRQNGNGGTDHGHASALFVIGGDVKGRKVHGRWPGLEPEQLHEGRDLALTTDFRAVFSEVAAKQLGATKLDALFPGFENAKASWLGVM
ncbi:MAG: hypothetical protein JWL60_2591 [Gemmatimonadetes bacterium]|jgi:uncharacterized protein (DUF1501 family)|nr:hypothetical protein [Gemmatimonadota bacterium]